MIGGRGYEKALYLEENEHELMWWQIWWYKARFRVFDLIFLNSAKCEIIVSLSTFVFGFMLLYQLNSFQYSIYSTLDHVIPVHVWAILLIILGLIQLLCILGGESFSRRLCSMAMVALWVFLGVLFINSSYPSVELVLLSFVQAFSSGWSFLYIGMYGIQLKCR